MSRRDQQRHTPQPPPRRVQFARGSGQVNENEEVDDGGSEESFCVFTYPGPDSLGGVGTSGDFAIYSTGGSGFPAYVGLQNVSGIQIGNRNVMSIATCDVRDSKKKYTGSPPPASAGAFSVSRGRSAVSVATASSGRGQGVAMASATVERSHERRSPRSRQQSQQQSRSGSERVSSLERRSDKSSVKTTRETSTSSQTGSTLETSSASTKIVGSCRQPSAPPQPVETSDDDFVCLDDVKIAGRPVVISPEDGVRSAVARPFRTGRDTGVDALIPGSVVSIRCYCHGTSGRRRFCPFAEDVYSESAWLDKMQRVRQAAVDVERYGPLALYNAVVSESPQILDADPGLDRELGRFYVKTAFRKFELSVSDMFRHSGRLRCAVQDFFVENAEAVDAMVRRIVERVGDSLDRGLYGVVMMMDRYANALEGREELPVHVAARVAAAIAVDCHAYTPHYASVFGAGPKNVLEIFDLVLSALCSFAIVLPPQVMAYAGLRGGLPLFEGVAYRPRGVAVEGTWNGSMQNVCDLLTNGVSVSIHLLDFAGDVTGILRSFGLFCASLREQRRFDTRLRIIVDAWAVDLIYVVSFILGEGKDYPELTYAVNVPQFFWDRYVEEGSSNRWYVFHKAECRSLCRVDSKGFRAAYERLEVEGNGMKLSPWWIVRHLDACVALGNTAVVYPHNLKGPIVGESGSLALCGPDLSLVCNNFLGVFPENKVDICLENCLLEGSGADDSANAGEGEDPILGCDVYFSFRSLRALIRDAVVIGNVLIDCIIRDNVFGAGDVMCLYRPLQLRVLGFHAVLGRLGIMYGDEASVIFSRRLAEFIYFTAVRASVDLCMRGAEPFPRFSRSIFAAGHFHPDLYEGSSSTSIRESGTLPAAAWSRLREDVMRYGVRNAAFVSEGMAETSADVVGTTRGMWPRAFNLSLEPSPLFVSPKERCVGDAFRVAEDLRLDLPSAPDRSLLVLVKNQCVYLPVINRYLSEIPRSRAVLAVRMGYAAGMYAGSHDGGDEDEDEDRASLETGWMTSQDAVLKMCVDRQPYVDQGQANPLFLGSGRSMVEVARHLRRAGTLGLAIGLYRCHVASPIAQR